MIGIIENRAAGTAKAIMGRPASARKIGKCIGM
jgi:hypothetical protein